MKQTKKEAFVFNDLFDVDELQDLQNMFSEAHEVASIITLPDGTPLTKPCRFSRFCFSLVRQTKKGAANCLKSDAEIGKYNPDGPIIQKCLSAGLWDAGVSINVGGVHVANWLIGQVRNEEIETSKIENYANEIGAEPKELLAAFHEVPEVSIQKFKNIANLLYVFVNQISDKAYKNYLLKKEIENKEAVVEELMRHEKQLLKAKNEIQIIADNAPSIIWKLEASLTGEIQSAFISDIVDELLDLPKGTVNNNIAFYFTLVIPEYLPQINDEIRKAINNPGDIISVVYPIKKGDGEIAWLESTGRAYAEEDKFLIFGNTIDITKQKQSEKELMEAKENAEESDRLKSAFLANMSHEIRTPMNGILGFTSLLEDPELSGDQKHVYIDIIKKSGDRLLNTVNDIIEISKIETGQVTLTQKKLNIKEYLQTLCNFFALEAKTKNISIKLEVNLSESEVWIKTDETKLTSILNNLIKNAIKYSNEGEIMVVCKKNGSLLEFEVSDTGIGIPEDRTEAIFDRFVQADIEDKNVHEGSGLGLAITKSYVEMLGGEIQVKSELGTGSVFCFTIRNNPTTVVSKIKTVKKMDKNTIGDKTILLVEDDNVSYQLTKSILAKLSYNLIWKENGKDGIDLLRNGADIDLILMDLKLPGMGGLEATESIREFNTTVPIIAQTAYALEGDKEKCMAAGCNDYISKPVNREDLIRLIEKYMNLKV